MALIDNKYFLDFENLSQYDELIKQYIQDTTGSNDTVNNILASLAEIADQLDKDAEDIAANAEAIKTNADAIKVLNGDADVEGSVANQVKTAVDSAVESIVDGAPEALDTLKEIADWIAEDETGAAALVERVSDLEEHAEALEAADEDLRAYVDAQDKAYYDAIQPINNLKIASLFAVKQGADESVQDVLSAVEEGQAVKLVADQTVAEDIVIEKSCYIDANGATFTGSVIVPADAEVIIENATFSQPVVVA